MPIGVVDGLSNILSDGSLTLGFKAKIPLPTAAVIGLGVSGATDADDDGQWNQHQRPCA